jgi:hypothetical protein
MLFVYKQDNFELPGRAARIIVDRNLPRREVHILKALLLLTLATALTAMANDATGTWTGDLVQQRDGEERKSPAHLVLKQEGTQLTGTAGPSPDEQHPILKGKIDGGKLSFEVEREGGVISFVLTQENDEIKGELTMQREGATRTGKLSLKRQKT